MNAMQRRMDADARTLDGESYKTLHPSGEVERSARTRNTASRGTARRPVAVLGAGFSGLVAAHELARRGHEVVVLEAGRRVAGLASTHRDRDGFQQDVGARFITNRLARAVGVSDRCHTLARYGESVWIGGRAVGYPYGLMRVPRFVRGAIAERLRGRDREPASATEWFRSRYGTPFADEIALPLLEAWSGVSPSKLASSVGTKLAPSVTKAMALKLASVCTRRPVAIGYSRERPEHPGLVLVYPERGVASLCETLAESLAGRIQLESPVERIYVRKGRAVGVRARSRDLDVAAVVSTLPVNELPGLADGTGLLERFRPFRFRPMVFVGLRLAGRGLLPAVVTWTPGAQFPFFRLVEAPLAVPWLAPEGKTLVTADIGAEIGDSTWEADDDALGEACIERMAPIVPDARSRYRGCTVLRTPIAYPVFLNSYEATRQALSESTGVAGLWSVGRHGEFANLPMEDVYWRARSVAQWILQVIH